MSKASNCLTCNGAGTLNFLDDVCEVCGGSGKTVARREDGKVMKPASYVVPDVSEAVRG